MRSCELLLSYSLLVSLQAVQVQRSSTPLRDATIGAASIAFGGFLLPAAGMVALELRNRLAFLGATVKRLHMLVKPCRRCAAAVLH